MSDIIDYLVKTNLQMLVHLGGSFDEKMQRYSDGSEFRSRRYIIGTNGIVYKCFTAFVLILIIIVLIHNKYF